MQKLFVMCGIPASGKSLIAKKIAGQERTVILSADEIRRLLFENQAYDPDQNKEVFKLLRKGLWKALKARENVIIDAVNRKPSQRCFYIEQAKTRGYYTVCVYCKKHYTHAILANDRRNRRHQKPMSSFEHIYQDFKCPELWEGWDEIRIINGDKYSVDVEGQLPVQETPHKKRSRSRWE